MPLEWNGKYFSQSKKSAKKTPQLFQESAGELASNSQVENQGLIALSVLIGKTDIITLEFQSLEDLLRCYKYLNLQGKKDGKKNTLCYYLSRDNISLEYFVNQSKTYFLLDPALFKQLLKVLHLPSHDEYCAYLTKLDFNTVPGELKRTEDEPKLITPAEKRGGSIKGTEQDAYNEKSARGNSWL